MQSSLGGNKVLQQARHETVQILIDQIFVEKEIENIKKQFASTLQFSLVGAMRLFDQRGKGSVSLPEFQENCHKLLSPCKNTYLLNSQTYQIFRRFDKDNDGYLNHEEFAAFILPGADEKVSNKIASRNDISFSEDSYELLVRMIKTMISMNGSHEFLRTRLRKALEKQYLTLNDAFKSIDFNEQGLLNIYDLEELLDEPRKNVSTSEFVKEIELLVNLYDRKNAPGSPSRGISHWSFIEQLTPQHQHLPSPIVHNATSSESEVD